MEQGGNLPSLPNNAHPLRRKRRLRDGENSNTGTDKALLTIVVLEKRGRLRLSKGGKAVKATPDADGRIAS